MNLVGSNVVGAPGRGATDGLIVGLVAPPGIAGRGVSSFFFTIRTSEWTVGLVAPPTTGVAGTTVTVGLTVGFLAGSTLRIGDGELAALAVMLISPFKLTNTW